MSKGKAKATATATATATAQNPLADLVAVLRPAIMAGVAKELANSFGVSLPGNGNGNDVGNGNDAEKEKGIIAATTRQKLVGAWYLAEISAENLLLRAAKAYEQMDGTKELLTDCRAIKDDDGNAIYPDTRTPSGYIAALRKRAKEEGRDFKNSEIPPWVVKFSRLFDKVRKRQEQWRKERGIKSEHGNAGGNNPVHTRVTEKGIFSAWLLKNYDASPFIAGASTMVDCWGDWQNAANILAEKANMKALDIAAAMKKAKEKAKKQ